MSNPYLPKLAKIESIKDEAPETGTFKIKILDERIRNSFNFSPGQFIELTVFGYGEAPFSITSSPAVHENFSITVRRMGNVTRGLFRLKEGDFVGVRGPFGRGWPLEKIKENDVLVVAGGIGLAPLKPLIEYIILHRKMYNKVTLFYGAKTPRDIIYKELFDVWRKYIDIELTVDFAEKVWSGHSGPVTVLFKNFRPSSNNLYSVQCGPPIMMHFVTRQLSNIGLPPEKIYFSLERNMKCGMGFCGKCMTGGRYVCREGPVFNYNEVKSFLETPV